MQLRLVLPLLLGLGIGLWFGRAIPQAELRRARAEIESLKASAVSRSAPSHEAMAGVQAMLRVEPHRRAKDESSEGPEDVMVSTNPVAQTPAPPVGMSPTGGVEVTTVSNGIQMAKEAWDLRRQVARSAFIERAQLDAEGAASFDVLMDAMNLRLGTAVDRWAAHIRERKEFTAETGVRMMKDISDALVMTYDEMDRKLPAGWRERAGSRFELVRFADPEILTPLENLDVAPLEDFGESDLP